MTISCALKTKDVITSYSIHYTNLYDMNMPKSLTALGGYDAVTHALEAYVSVLANEYSDGQALQALKMLKEYLPSSYANGANDPIAREKVHNAATIAGVAFANAFLGVCHSMAHKLGAVV